MEEWKIIPNHENYEISNYGIIRNIKTKEIKNTPTNTYGYKTVCLNSHKYFVHRLVAIVFIPNPNNYPQINHKDENKENNCIDNLEWCNAKYNSNYGNQSEKIKNGQKEYFEARKNNLPYKRKRPPKKNNDKNPNMVGSIKGNYFGYPSKEIYMQLHNGESFHMPNGGNFKGHKHSEESKKKTSESLKRKKEMIK